MAGDHTYISNINLVIDDLDNFYFIFLLLLLNYNLVFIYQCHFEIISCMLLCWSTAESRNQSIRDAKVTKVTLDELSGKKTALHYCFSLWQARM